MCYHASSMFTHGMSEHAMSCTHRYVLGEVEIHLHYSPSAQYQVWHDMHDRVEDDIIHSVCHAGYDVEWMQLPCLVLCGCGSSTTQARHGICHHSSTYHWHGMCDVGLRSSTWWLVVEMVSTISTHQAHHATPHLHHIPAYHTMGCWYTWCEQDMTCPCHTMCD